MRRIAIVDDSPTFLEAAAAYIAGLPGYALAGTARAADEALAIGQQWGGLGDDSVSGIDYLFTLRLGPAGWHVAEIAQREQCTRNERLPGEEDLPELCV
jgi:hypothetical protein